MTKRGYNRHIPRRTETGEKVLRARLSERETQEEFSRRFLVTPVTIHNWESGKTEHMQRVHKRVLDIIVERLKAEGRYMPKEAYETIWRATINAAPDPILV